MQGEVLLRWGTMGNVTASESCPHSTGPGICSDSSLRAGEALRQNARAATQAFVHVLCRPVLMPRRVYWTP